MCEEIFSNGENWGCLRTRKNICFIGTINLYNILVNILHRELGPPKKIKVDSLLRLTK